MGLEQIINYLSIKKNNLINKSKSILPLGLSLFFYLSPFVQQDALAQEMEEESNSRHFVYGPERPMEFEVRGSYKLGDGFDEASIVGLVENQRGINYLISYKKRIGDIGDDKEIFAFGTRLFPFGDMGEFKVVFEDNPESVNSGFYFTYRNFFDNRYLKLRFGHEEVNPDSGDKKTANILSVRTEVTKKFELNMLVSNDNRNHETDSHFGFGTTFYFPNNFYLSANLTTTSNSAEDPTKTISIGRFASYHNEKLPTGFLTYRGNGTKAFYLAGFMFGGKQQFVRPAAIGMSEGFFFGSAALSELRNLRGMNDFGVFTTEYEIAEYVLFATYLDIDIPGTNLSTIVKGINFSFSPNLKSSDKNVHLDFAYGKEITPNFRTMNHDEDDFTSIGGGVSLGKLELGLSHILKSKEYSFGVRYQF